MIGCFFYIAVNAAVLLITGLLFDGFELSGWGAAILAAVLLGLANTLVKPIIVVLTLPVTIVTLGIFIFVINALLLYVISWVMGDLFMIENFGTAILAAVVMAVINALLNLLSKPFTS
ncbi:hypothetical protein JCM19037_869 [Geomicrobium sp. JCM 19037]|uniref:phage holin family protein n=1 Tax=unclassified Geomicrobium TaxID=2628951 RepID=UPI00045F33ED|nr:MULTISPECIES: phage holin family protein [unclassified Geomicrobium]GAK02623.1 hypothetical protein JCM19037_869 [Geomicrobium sp. JCM 19037]GAK11665.1 hypothetical protein JCM19039_1375 [Geomicrobium sp. JCM 19039]